MITLKFARKCNMKKLETHELPNRNSFFDFYMDNFNKGAIYDVKETPSEYHEVAQVAYDTVLKTMQEGELTHPGNGWKDVSLLEHAQHASNHAVDAQYEIQHNIQYPTGEDHTGNCMTRCAMIKFLKSKTI